MLLYFCTTNSRREQTYGTYSLITRGSTKTLSCSPQVGLHCAPHLSLSLCTTTKPRERQQNHSLSLSLSLLLTHSQKFHFRFPGFLKINQSHYTITFSLPLQPFHYITHSANKNPVFAHPSQWKLLSPPALPGVAGPAARCYHHCPPPSVALLLLKDALSSLVHEMNLSLLYSAMFCWVLKLVAAAWGAEGAGRGRAGRRGMLSYLVCACVWVLHLVSD